MSSSGASDFEIYVLRFVQALIVLIHDHWLTILIAVIVSVICLKFLTFLGFGAHRSLRLTRRIVDGGREKMQSPAILAQQPHQLFNQTVGIFSRPIFCTVCKKIILANARTCGICLFSAHENCLKENHSSCKDVSLSSGTVSKLEYSKHINTHGNSHHHHHNHDNDQLLSPQSFRVSQYAFHHQWRQGNFSAVHDLCTICHEAVGSLFSLNEAFNCVWCQRKIHEGCMAMLKTQVCDCGEHARLIVPPTCISSQSTHQPTTKNNNNMIVIKETKSNGKKSRRRFRDRIKKKVTGLLFGALSAAEEEKMKTCWLVQIPPAVFPDNCPLLVFVNPKAGGQWGPHLLRTFKALLNPLQVFDLSCEGGTIHGLTMFRRVPRCRVLACGGDGTIAWVLQGIDSVYGTTTTTATTRESKTSSSGGGDVTHPYTLRSAKKKHDDTLEEKSSLPDEDDISYWPPVAVLPLGTGNDLSRSLDWGGGFSKEDDISSILRQVQHSHVARMDRWNCQYESNKTKYNQEHVMNCYLGIGMDAEIALKFHTLREKNPEQFASQLQNKTRYAQLGAEAYFFPNKLALDGVEIIVDGVVLDLQGLEGVLLCNVNNYGGGSDLWGSSTSVPRLVDQFGEAVQQNMQNIFDDEESDDENDEKNVLLQPPSMQDTLLEVVGIRSSLHMGVIQIGLARSVRLAQGHHITIQCSMKKTRNIQIDGEPIQLHGQGTITISHRNQANMLRPSSSHVHRNLADVTDVLDWAHTTKVINTKQREELLAAFHRTTTKNNQVFL